MKLPRKNDTRVDYESMQDIVYTLLIDDENSGILLSIQGKRTHAAAYSLFKDMAKKGVPIDNYPYAFYPLPFRQLDGVNYQY